MVAQPPLRAGRTTTSQPPKDIQPGSRKAIAGLRLFAETFSERPDLLVKLAAMIVRNAKP